MRSSSSFARALVVLAAAVAVPGARAGDAVVAHEDASTSPPAGPPPVEVKIHPERIETGRPFLVELTAAPLAAPLTVDDARVGRRRCALVASEGTRAVVLCSVAIEERAKKLPVRVTAHGTDGAKVVVERTVVVEPGAYAESHLKVARRYTRPSRKDRARSAREKARLERALADGVAQSLVTGPFVVPTAGAKTAAFGTLRTYNKRRDRSRHQGLDLDGAVGDLVVATQSGRVALAEDRFYSGNTVVIDHGMGLFSLYLHLSRLDVKNGDEVTPGQPIGLVGATGRVTGPHLHFAVKLDGEYLDPEALLALPLVGAGSAAPSAPPLVDDGAPAPDEARARDAP